MIYRSFFYSVLFFNVKPASETSFVVKFSITC
eukprot:UN02506